VKLFGDENAGNGARERFRRGREKCLGIGPLDGPSGNSCRRSLGSDSNPTKVEDWKVSLLGISAGCTRAASHDSSARHLLYVPSLEEYHIDIHPNDVEHHTGRGGQCLERLHEHQAAHNSIFQG
jgi:hypothetical protein